MHALSVFLAFDLNNLLLFVYFPHCYGSCYYVQKRRCSCYILWFLYIHKNSWAFLFSTANSRFVCFPHLTHRFIQYEKLYNFSTVLIRWMCFEFCWRSSRRPILSIHWRNLDEKIHACHTCLRLFVPSDFFRYLNNNMKCIGFVTRTRRSQSERKKWNRKKFKTSKNIKSTEFM